MFRLFLCCLLSWPVFVNAQLLLNASVDNRFDTVIEQLQLPLNEVIEPSNFADMQSRAWQPLASSGGNLGIINGTRWLRVSIQNLTSVDEWLFVLNNRGINQVDGWLHTSQGVQTFRIGALLNTNEGRDIAIPRLNTQLTIPADTSAVLYLLVTHRGFADLNGGLLALDFAIERQFSETISEVMFYGVLFTLFFYHLMLLVTTANKSYLVYCLFVLSTICFFSFTEGYLWFVLPHLPSLVYAIGHGSIGLICASAALFTLSHLQLSQQRWSRIFLWAVVGIGCAIALVRLALVGFPALVLGSLLAVITFLGIPVISLLRYFKFKDNFALLYFYAWSLWSVLAVAVVLTLFNLLPNDLSAFWSILKAAFALQSLILAWSLGFRIRKLYLDRTSAIAQNRAKSDLLTQVSHEIRTPMNGIIGTSQLLESHIHSDEAHHLNETIFHSGLSLLTIINDLLDLSRLDSGKVDIRPEPTAIKTLIQQVELTLQAQLKQKGLSLTVALTESTPTVVNIDGPRLRQVLFNIIGNAIKYTHEGGIKVGISYQHHELSLIIEDTGRGIPHDKIEHIFSPFEQVENTDRELRTGTGLGLHIARSLIELMGGRITLTSTPSVGTKVTILLPCDEVAQVDTPATTLSNLNKSLKVLIVDDNKVNRTVILGLFKNLGHTCLSAENGMEAVNLYFEKHEDIDCIFMDCEMPIMDGYTASVKIREIELAKHLPSKPIIAVTAHAYSGHADKIRAAGMDDQVPKPITRESIAIALNQLYHIDPLSL